ncbi:MAG: hypothetical protein V4510_03030 [bacterium]
MADLLPTVRTAAGQAEDAAASCAFAAGKKDEVERVAKSAR